jgi:hypothetical protein
MGLMDNIRKQVGSQFLEILEWLDDTHDTLVWRFPVYNQEIKMGAKLVVRENQLALFVNEGQAADLFAPAPTRCRRRTFRSSPRCAAGSTASRARSRPRSISSTRGSSPISSGAPRTRS